MTTVTKTRPGTRKDIAIKYVGKTHEECAEHMRAKCTPMPPAVKRCLETIRAAGDKGLTRDQAHALDGFNIAHFVNYVADFGHWADSGRTRVHCYKLTDLGRKALAETIG